MKKIEQEAEIFAHKKNNSIPDSHIEKMPKIILKAASIDGFKAGVKFAQRWIAVQYELPPIGDIVLFKDENYNCIVGFYTVSQKFMSFTFAAIGVKNVEINGVTHWRPIEYN